MTHLNISQRCFRPEKKFKSSAGDGTVLMLEDEGTKNLILKQLETKYDIVMDKGTKYFKMIDDSEITSLKKFEHMVCFNTNPKPVLLYLTSNNGIKYCFYIIKNTKEIFYIRHRFDSNLFETDTVIEGEIINNISTFLWSDILVYQGETNDDPLQDKIKLMTRLLKDSYTADTNFDVLKQELKIFVPIKNTVSFVRDYLPTVSYASRVTGIVFRPTLPTKIRNKNLIFILNKPFHKFKFSSSVNNQMEQHSKNSVVQPRRKIRKGVDEVTFDAHKTDRGPDVIDLYLRNKRDELIKYEIACVPDMKTSKLIKQMFSRSDQMIIQCSYSEKFGRWIPSSVSKKRKSDYLEDLL